MVYELVEITATVYEVGARVFLCGHDEFINLDHAMLILPEPERIEMNWTGAGFDCGTEYQDYYGVRDGSSFVTNFPMIGLDFRNISEGTSPDYPEHIGGFDTLIGDIGVEGAYGDFVTDILQEVNNDIDRLLDHLPLKNMWKEPSLKHIFRFVIAFEHVYTKSYDYYSGGFEYDSEVYWLGRVSIYDISRQADKQAS